MSKAVERRIPSRLEIATRVRGIISDQTRIMEDSFPESASLCCGSGLGLDPLDVAELACCCEESFGLEPQSLLKLPDGRPIHTATVSEFIDLVEGGTINASR